MEIPGRQKTYLLWSKRKTPVGPHIGCQVTGRTPLFDNYVKSAMCHSKGPLQKYAIQIYGS